MASARARRWGWTVAIVAATGTALVLAVLLSMTAAEGAIPERHYAVLFWANVAVAALLALVVGIAAARLVVRVKRGRFGSRLLAKLAGMFALVALVPGLVTYTVSWQFVSRSIEAWFDVKVASALDAGLTLGKGTFETLAAELATKTRVAADRLAERRTPITAIELERLREQLAASEVSLVAASGQVLVTAGVAGVGGGLAGPEAALAPGRPAAALLRQARSAGAASAIEGLEDEAAAAQGAARLRALARVPVADIRLAAGAEPMLMVVQAVPRSVVVNALAVQAAYSEYQERALARDALERMVIGTLTLGLVLAVFGAVLVAVLLGNQIARPLLLLADGVRGVAAGDLRAKPVFDSSDELGGLTKSFAAMTQQIADARAEVQRGLGQQEAARRRVQTILDTLSAGVIVLDAEGRVETVNPGATRILRRPLAAETGRRLAEVSALAELGTLVAARFERLAAHPEPGERDQWQEALEFARGDGVSLSLLVRGAWLPGGARLVVFDDITEVVSAQRSVAWAEVARRVAHEIKNPLTPIQLSAERVQHRLEAKLPEEADRALLRKSVATIVAQVQAMQSLVNAFRDYARLPAATLAPLDLNGVVAEVLALYGQEADSGRLEWLPAPGAALVMGDASQLRQLVHNLVQNALDAVAGREGGHVRVRTRLVPSAPAAAAGEATSVALAEVRLEVQDNGPGFAQKVLKRAFEPYVTTKAKGTGLGLAVVKKVAEEHHARLRVGNVARDGSAATDPGAEVAGALVSLSFAALEAGAGAASATASPAGAAAAAGV
jgi:nitrogen fixation/metabolism regulation signal transduction histidine kinase